LEEVIKAAYHAGGVHVVVMIRTFRGAKRDGFGRQDLLNSFAAIREFLRENNVLK
jgi:hypothetical protein